ncbi:MAG: Asp-tRNA(Asn)/Glu-tRNA(Gln) amidotransferase subunit GatC [Deltaproteobacteria bacterium]|nr:Asp-tRNA(Asn)/Glu-tRNA(Gln) amidotransferase subunit GatC [Deltaproteobacteria bacterium]
MSIDESTVRAVLGLARLELPGSSAGGPNEEENRRAVEVMVDEFSKIVDYMAILGEADVEGIEPLYSPMIDPQPPRPDEPVADPAKSEAILKEAPELVGRYFSVPRIF